MPVRRGAPAALPERIDLPPASVAAHAPLAARMRPRSLAEVVGQEHLIGEQGALTRMVGRGHLASMVLWGPPGTGKTTLARLLAEAAGAPFVTLSAVMSGVADVRAAIARARDWIDRGGASTVLFVDEIHRFNKAQQDALLPQVEDGTITLIGATTENPYFEVNSALLSRLRVFRLEPIGDQDLGVIVDRALVDERGYGGRVVLPADAREHLVAISAGDARAALNVLEAAAAMAGAEGADGTVAAGPTGQVGAAQETPASGPEIAADGQEAAGPDAVQAGGVRLEPGSATATVAPGLELIEAAAQQRILAYDRSGDGHYGTVSAFIKSMRGNDPDAALYWLATMVAAGEDPRFIARRIIIAASEDVGNADPRALQVAIAAAQALDWVGLPEAQYALAQATVTVCCALKSNRVGRAYWAAMEDVREHGSQPVPKHLLPASHPRMRSHGIGVGYRYPHDYEAADVEQQYLPDILVGRRYYEPSDQGWERTIRERMEALVEERRTAREGGGPRKRR